MKINFWHKLVAPKLAKAHVREEQFRRMYEGEVTYVRGQYNRLSNAYWRLVDENADLKGHQGIAAQNAEGKNLPNSQDGSQTASSSKPVVENTVVSAGTNGDAHSSAPTVTK